MKKQWQNGTKEVRRFTKSRPSEVTWTVVGFAFGVLVAFLVTGIGIAMLGGAFAVAGLSLPLMLAMLLGLAGNRFGVGRDRRREGIRLSELL